MTVVVRGYARAAVSGDPLPANGGRDRRLSRVMRPPTFRCPPAVIGLAFRGIGKGVVGEVDELGVLERVGVVVAIRVPVFQLTPPRGVQLDRGREIGRAS